MPATATAATILRCPVRGCGLPLHRSPAALACDRGHSFDRARSGYFNLLQPQDRRSARPGDSREAAAARRRLIEAGTGVPLLADLAARCRDLAPSADIVSAGSPLRPFRMLDVGCGEGSLIAALAGARSGEAHGLDLSAAALDLAARRHPAATWIAANADRRLPYESRAFDLVVSLTGPKNGAEFQRVLAPGGWLLLGVPSADDLVELRAAVLGAGLLRERLDKALARLSAEAPALELAARWQVRFAARLDAAALRDLLAATYRGARHAERPRAAGISALEVTMGRDLALLRRTLAGETSGLAAPPSC